MKRFDNQPQAVRALQEDAIADGLGPILIEMRQPDEDESVQPAQMEQGSMSKFIDDIENEVKATLEFGRPVPDAEQLRAGVKALHDAGVAVEAEVGRNEKIAQRTTQLAKFARDAMADGASEGEVFSVLADCRNALNRARYRVKAGRGWERVEIRQMRGPLVEFTGRLLCSTEFVAHRKDIRMTLELYETRGGALVAVNASNLADESGQEDERCVVVPPTADVQAMRFAVMDAFEWNTEAKKMVRKQLGWDLRMEVP